MGDTWCGRENFKQKYEKQTNREENYPGPVLIDLLCATNLRRPSNISNLNNGRNIAIFNWRLEFTIDSDAWIISGTI